MKLPKWLDNWMVRKFNIHPVSTIEVFTPTTAAVLNYTERPELEKLIKSSIKLPGKQLLLFGHSGSGKTTVLRNVLNSLNIKFVRTQCVATTTFADIIRGGFDSLDKFIVAEKSKSSNYKISSKLVGEYNLIKSEIGAEESTNETTKFVRLLPPQLSSQKLASFYGEAGIVWVIEDFHKVNESEKKQIADMLKVFVDNASDYPVSKVVCIGACEAAGELIKLDSNLKNRVAETKVSLLSDKDIRKIVVSGFSMLNVKITTSLEDKLVYYSARLGSSAHQMCLDICEAEGITRRKKDNVCLNDKHFNHAINGFIKQNEGTLSSIYDAAVKNQLGWYVLKTFSRNSHEKLSFKEIKKLVNLNGRSFSDNEIKEKLDELSQQDFGVIFYSPVSEKYSLASPFWETFLRMQFAIEAAQQNNTDRNRQNQNLKLINQNDRDAAVESLMLELLNKLHNRRY